LDFFVAYFQPLAGSWASNNFLFIALVRVAIHFIVTYIGDVDGGHEIVLWIPHGKPTGAVKR